eukprot:m.56535 g.56535  ORF g.56535 m.56535 type:complete len:364 (+) comp34609_c0_seq2:126-1217(+)
MISCKAFARCSLLALFVFSAANGARSLLRELNIDKSQVSVSGLSAGAFFSVQFHVAFSNEIMGAGIVAGGPYWCAKDDVKIAIDTCMANPQFINVSELVAVTKSAALAGNISSLLNLKTSKVFLFSGRNDTVVRQGAMQKLLEYYQQFVENSDDNLKHVFTYAAQHAMVTDDYGSACGYLGVPFINNCGYSVPFNMLKHIYGNLNYAEASAANKSNLQEFDQRQYFSAPHLVSMDDSGYLYVPSNCRKSSSKCRFHIAFHGCHQGRSFVNATFAEHGGYNQIAEVNDIVILYPQSYPSEFNPQGCFDWWGYTSSAYASKDGIQMTGVKAMVDHLIEQAGFSAIETLSKTLFSLCMILIFGTTL